MKYIEDILDHVVNSDKLLEIFSNEKTIFSSINRQIKKGNALTDRQYQLLKTKLLEKREVFDIENFDDILDCTSMPFRKINREQIISIEKNDSIFNGSTSIKIRFPFNKKTIVDIEKIVSRYRTSYQHQKGSHEHYFKFHEPIILDIVEVFSKKNFIIDPLLISLAADVKSVKDNLEDHTPGLYDLSIKNVREEARELIAKEIGDINIANKIKVKDRSRRYGLAHVECNDPGNLIGHIAFRKNQDVLVNPEYWSINHVVEALIKLDRFPLLVLIDEGKELEQVNQVYKAFNDVIPSEKQVCLFRVDSNGDYNLNNFIQDKNFNNFLDESIELVYILKSKLPKLLLRVDWKPMCVYALSSARSNNYVSLYCEEHSDLIIYHDKEHSPFRVKHAYY